MTNHHWPDSSDQQTLLKIQNLWKQCFVSSCLQSHVETGDLSCPTNLIILRNLFLTYRESDINSRVFSLDCYQSYRGGPSCHTGLHRYHSQDGLEPGHTFLFNYVSDLLSNIPLWSRVWRSKRRTVWLRCIISSLGYNYQLVVRAQLAIVSILRTARVSVSIKVWRHRKSHLWYPPSPLHHSTPQDRLSQHSFSIHFFLPKYPVWCFLWLDVNDADRLSVLWANILCIILIFTPVFPPIKTPLDI